MIIFSILYRNIPNYPIANFHIFLIIDFQNNSIIDFYSCQIVIFSTIVQLSVEHFCIL